MFGGAPNIDDMTNAPTTIRQRAYCDLDHPGDDVEADRWCELHHRPATPRRFVVRCEDGQVRAPHPFTTAADAETWAEWGHICTRHHTIEVV